MKDFLEDANWSDAEQLDLAGDASARSYSRLRRASGETAVLMTDPDKRTALFARLSQYLQSLGLSAPQIYAQDADTGLMLIEDFGDGLIAQLARDPKTEQQLYLAATDVLITLHQSVPAADLPIATPHHLAGMITPVFDHYMKDQSLSNGLRAKITETFATLLDQHAHQTTVTVLRDYHAENILWLPDRSGVQRAGLLDFQDAWQGHPGYDLISLLQDARRDLYDGTSKTVIDHYVAKTGQDRESLMIAMALLGAQRHLRILGIFARLAVVRGKPHYIGYVPRTWAHLQTCLSHPTLYDIKALLDPVLPQPDPAHLSKLRGAP